MKEIKSTRQVNATVDNQSTPTITTPDGKPVVSLNDLKAVIPSTNGKALPTAKQLRENDQMILSQPLSDGDIHVYASGFTSDADGPLPSSTNSPPNRSCNAFASATTPRIGPCRSSFIGGLLRQRLLCI